jgi:hypothetical protein
MDTKNLHLNLTLKDIQKERARRRPGIELASPDVQAEHCIAWIRANCQLLDPAALGGVLPFDLYDYQEEFVRFFMTEVAKARRGEPAGIRTEKSRQMGDSWLMMAIELYTLAHWKDFQAINISRKEQKVDDGGQNSTTDSLHGKIRFMHERLKGENAFPLDIRHLSIVNPALGGTIIGEAANPHAGRGGTFLYGLWDETAATEHSRAIHASFEQAVRCPHYLSTPQGKSNFFAYAKQIETLRQVRHHWTKHPVKGEGKHLCQGDVKHPGHSEVCPGGEWRSAWYEEQCQRMTPEAIAQELDISYERSVFGRAFPEFDAAKHGASDLRIEPGGVFVASIDPGVTTAAAVLLQFVDVQGIRECRVMDAWQGHDATAATYAELIERWQAQFGKLQVTGDPSGFNRGLTYGQSVFGELGTRYSIQVVAPPPGQTVGDRVRLVRDLMANRELGGGRCGRFAYRAELEDFARDIEEAKWPTDREGAVIRETDLAHNEAEHTADALCYGVAYYCGRSSTVLPRICPPSGYRPYTAGWRNWEF